MEIPYKRVLILLNYISVIICVVPMIKEETLRRNLELCDKLGQQPYFESEMVVGKPWRIYYTWYMDLENKCLDMKFKNATETIINRIFHDMNEYMEQQPTWSAASLFLSVGKAPHEMLLFTDQGPAGRFTAVPNVARDGNISPHRNSVPLLRFQLKLIRGGRFLIMLDCNIGVATLSARLAEPPYRAEIASAAAEMNFGETGSHACLQDTNKNENFVIE